MCMEGSFHPERSSSGAALDSELRYKLSGFVRGRVGGIAGINEEGLKGKAKRISTLGVCCWFGVLLFVFLLFFFSFFFFSRHRNR